MRTIESIISRPIPTALQLHYMILAGVFNGIGTPSVNLDTIIHEIIERAKWSFDHTKMETLEDDLQILAARHDSDWYWRRGFLYSNIRLALGVATLLHWLGWKRWIIAFWVFYTVSFTREARFSYYS